MKKVVIKRADDTVYVFDEDLGVYGKGSNLDEAFDAFTRNQGAHDTLIETLDLASNESDEGRVASDSDRRHSVLGRVLDGMFFAAGFSFAFASFVLVAALSVAPILKNQAGDIKSLIGEAISSTEFDLKAVFYDTLGGDAPRCYRCVIQAVARSVAQDLENASPEERMQLEQDIATISRYYRGEAVD